MSLKHEIGAAGCDPKLHCHSCHIDEPNNPRYIACFECGHVYPTARSLRRAYRREWNRLALSEWRSAPWIPPPGFGSKFGAAWVWLRSRFCRARDITFCQLCTHDF